MGFKKRSAASFKRIYVRRNINGLVEVGFLAIPASGKKLLSETR